MGYITMTKKGREKMCKAHAGEIVLPAIKTIAFGNGGVTDERIPIPVTGDETALRRELTRVEPEYSFPVPTICEYLSSIPKDALPNTYISELGFYDAEGDLVVYSTFLEKGKDEDVQFDFAVKEIF